ncbi:MAG: GntR family transcriptional regulator [Paracoccaceae bacterium]|nr:GntR family transcriptional regulator [Paracoccaceae bacterium]
MAKSKPDTRSSGELAYEKLLSSLRSGVFTPGARLREEEVSEALGLSRTPVREALRRLEADGIVEHRPRIGAVIRSLSHTEVVELYEMRLVLERTAAEMAAKHGAEAEFDTLDTLNDRIEAERENAALAAAINQDFHRCLYLAARNRFLMEAARALNNSLLLLGPTTFTDAGRIAVVVDEHRAIVTALRNRDAEAAGVAAEAHLQTSLRQRLASLSA